MPGKLQKINWNIFKIKNENSPRAFEELCYHLFCRKYRQDEGVRVDYNQKGIETYPVKISKDYIGFQSKFFENKLSDPASVKQINHSVDLAKQTYPELTTIIIYTNKSFGAKETAYKLKIEKNAQPVIITWVMESNLQSLLVLPSNLDLAGLYFGMGNEIGFLKDNFNADVFTLLQSASYISVPLFKQDDAKAIIDLKEEILNSPSKEFLITGSPGSGKSILMQSLFQQMAGLTESDEAKMRNRITTQGAIPMLVNLKLCATDSLENILRGRQQENNIIGKGLKFIYLFDGVDELDEVKINQVLSYIFELGHKQTTARIIFSCRTGSLNKLRTKNYFKTIAELTIAPLDISYIDRYFKSKSNQQRILKLNDFKENNRDLLNDIKDILLINIFWDVIEKLPINSSSINLLEEKVNHLLQKPVHRKNIEELNLPASKDQAILMLNQKISFLFHKKFQFRFPQKKLQALIGKTFPRIGYQSINDILNYNAHLFFENDYSDNLSEQNYIYQHRRYQEYFFAQKLKRKYEKDPQILRDLKILSGNDFFQQLFIPFLRNSYEKEGNLVGFLGLNLMEVYLGNHKGWGADQAFYKDSKPFIKALAVQNDYIFEQLLNDENLQVKAKLFVPESEIMYGFEELKKNKKRHREYESLQEIFEDDLAKLMRLHAELHKNKKYAFSDEVQRHIDTIRGIFTNENFRKKFEESRNHHLTDPAWEEWESYLYGLLVFKQQKLSTVYKNKILSHYSTMKETPYSPGEEGKTKLVKGFIRVCLEFRRKEFLKVAATFDQYQFFSLLEVLTEFKYLPYVFSGQDIEAIIKDMLTNPLHKEWSFNAAFVFFKKLFNYEISGDEINTAKAEFKELEMSRGVDMRQNKTHYRAAVISFIFDRYNFELFQKAEKRSSLRWYNELGVFCSLYTDFVRLLDGRKDLPSVCGDFYRYVSYYNKEDYKYFTTDLTLLWSHIFINGQIDGESKKDLAKIVIRKEFNVLPFEFYLNVKLVNRDLYLELVTENDLEQFEKQLFKTEDFFQDYIDKCFEFSIMYTEVNNSKSMDYFVKGINDGILRHGWRKDYLVSYLLIEALTIIYKNNWAAEDKLSEYTREIFTLAIRVRNITDGKGTHYGPYHLIESIAAYDQVMASGLKDELHEKIGRNSNQTIAAIIKAKIRKGLSLEDVEEEIEELRIDYDHSGKRQSSYFIEKFKVYFEIARNHFYPEEDRKSAFKIAYDQIEEIIKPGFVYVDFNNDLRNETEEYVLLCGEYKLRFNIPENKEDSSYKSPGYDPGIERKFVRRIAAIKTSKALIELYKDLNHYESNIKLMERQSWVELVRKTFEVEGNIKLFTGFLNRMSYPHVDNFGTNTAYCHYGMAEALQNVNTTMEMLQYLSLNSGHGGFLHVMKAYDVLRDKEMCLKLFERFLSFCKLLVN